jgi:multidrug resistance efflux pump
MTRTSHSLSAGANRTHSRSSIARRMAYALRAHERATAALMRSPDASDASIASAEGIDVHAVRRAREDLNRRRTGSPSPLLGSSLGGGVCE